MHVYPTEINAVDGHKQIDHANVHPVDATDIQHMVSTQKPAYVCRSPSLDQSDWGHVWYNNFLQKFKTEP